MVDVLKEVTKNIKNRKKMYAFDHRRISHLPLRNEFNILIQ